jgi:hypothetical protein
MIGTLHAYTRSLSRCSQVFEGLKGTMYPCVVIKKADTEITVCQVDEGEVGIVSRPVAAALSMFICDLLINLTSKESTGIGGQDTVVQIEAARRMLLTEAGLARVRRCTRIPMRLA